MAHLRAESGQFAELQNDSNNAADSTWAGRGGAQRAAPPTRPTPEVRANWAEADLPPLRAEADALPLLPDDTGVTPTGGTTPPVEPATNAGGIQWESAERLPAPSAAAPRTSEKETKLVAPKPHKPQELMPAPGVRQGPTAIGAHLSIGPNETATERALLLQQMLEKSQAEARTLRDKVQTLERQNQQTGEERDQFQRTAERSAADAARYRVKMEALSEEAVSMRERLQRVEKQDLQTLHDIISVLERLALEGPPRKAGH